jgi:hypothetical protein
VALPLVPALTPGWPRTGGKAVLLLAIPYAVYGIVRARRDTLTPSVLLLAAAFPLYALYAGNGVVLTTGDNAATRVLPSLMLTRQTVDLSQTPPFNGARLPYAGIRIGTRVLNVFPSGTALVVLPYAALALAGSGGQVTPELVSRWDKHASALLMTGAAILAFLAFRRWGDGPALAGATAFALASPLPSNAAQSLWSFTGEAFCISAALYLLLGSSRRAGAAGVAAAFAFACRPTALLGAAALGIALAPTDRRAAARYGSAFAAGSAAVCAAQFALYGHVLGAYGALNTGHAAFNPELLSGIAGVLASPSRGLLVFCPWVLLLPFAFRAARGDRETRIWVAAAAGAASASVLLSATHLLWWGGWSQGPRLATEAAPFLGLAAVPLALRGRRLLRPAFLALAAFSAVVQLLLSYVPAAWEWNGVVLDRLGIRAMWRWRDSQLAAAWGAPFRVGPAPPNTTPGGEALTGSVDEPAEGAVVSGRLRVAGWARIEGVDLPVTIYVDGIARTPATDVRVARPDLCAALPALGDCTTAGYETVFAFGDGDAGEHQIYAIFRAPDGRVRRYPTRSFVWKKD